MLVEDLYKDKTIGIFGLGVTGNSLINKLAGKCKKIIVWDDNPEKIKNLPKTVEAISLDNYDWHKIDILFLSPGIPLKYPDPHKVVKIARDKKCRIICDIELLYETNHNPVFIGITGTNGKSTTASLIKHIFQLNNIENALGGNIGESACSLPLINKKGAYVIEVSSYQLELLEKTHFNIAIFLNLTPDHIDRHKNIKGYFDAKMNIFNHSVNNDYAIISLDNIFTKKAYKKLIRENIRKIIPISTKRILKNGISFIDNIIYNNFDKKETYVLDDIKLLKGEHNKENIIAAFSACYAYGLKPINIIDAIKSFIGLPHRVEFLKEINGVSYINDSKATNVEAAEKSIKSFKNIHLIIGGISKDDNIKPLIKHRDKIKHAYLIGKAQDQFANQIKNQIKYTKCDTLENAFNKIHIAGNLEPNDVVLLAPACASFDQWKNFEERGNFFKKLVFERLCNKI